jgi:hypothetical protein
VEIVWMSVVRCQLSVATDDGPRTRTKRFKSVGDWVVVAAVGVDSDSVLAGGLR